MGNDMTVFQEGQLEEDFWKAHGPKNESWTEFFSRSFQGLMKILVQPDRMVYTPEDIESRSEDTDFRLETFIVAGAIKADAGKKSTSKDEPAERNQLAAALWQQRRIIEGHPSPPLVLYLHTNTRCLVDAKEALPVCDKLGASLLAFDLPGCGHSDGTLTFQMYRDLDMVVRHATEVLGFTEIILWARGMATAIAVEYCAGTSYKRTRTRAGSTSSTSSTQSWSSSASSTVSNDAPLEAASPWASRIKFVVLDSPFISVKQMVVDGSKAIKCFGLAIPETIVRIACRIVRGQVRSRLGSDPFDLKPLRSLAQRGPDELPPCHIFSAQQDDYIPVSHGLEMSTGWARVSEGCTYREFSGRHFGEREPDILLEVAPIIRKYIDYDKEKEDAVAISTVDLRPFLLSSSTLRTSQHKIS